MKAQSDEERVHATKLYDHVIERGGQVELGEIAKPPHNFKSIKDIMSKVLEHEKKVTGLIHKLYEAALSEGDHATKIMLEWFVTEQVEEEAQAEEMLKKLELANDDGSALLFLDDEVGKQRSSK
jgi:ferritin